MFFLFYLKYDPKKYLSEGGSNAGNSDDSMRFGNFEFRSFAYDKENKNALFVGTATDFPQEVNGVYEIYYPDKSIAMKIVEKD